jgi:N-acetylglucosaminyl-diphospho-decaprenol L-rhamnosyltransferase
MDLSIIIVNWNSVNYLKECLQSILRETKGINFEIIVVDNASYDGSAEMIGAEFPEVKFVQSNENGGFAKANNLGFKNSSGRNLIFLNPDTRVIGSAIGDMLDFLNSRPDAGVVGCTLLYSDLSVQLHSVQPYPTVINQALDIDYLKKKWPHWNLWRLKALNQEHGQPEKVEVVPGACLMIKREVFQEVGLFSEDYFMYAEDIDLCYKVNRTNRKVFFIKGAKVVHHGSASSRNKKISFFSVVLTRESVFKFLMKTRGRRTAVSYRIVMSITAISRMGALAVALPLAGWKGQRKALKGTFNKWSKIWRWSIGLEKWARDLR